LKGLSRETLGLMIGTIGVIIFGVTLPMTRIAVVSLDPWFVTMGRAALAGLVALCVLVVLKRTVPTRSELMRLGVAAVFVIVGFPGFTGFAMRLVPASHGGVVLGILPLVVALFGAIDGEGGFGLGDVLLLGAVLSAASGYTVLAGLTKSRPGWEVISWTVVISLPVTLPFAFLTAPSDLFAVPLPHWGAFLYLGLMSQYVGFFFWNTGLAMGGQARVSQTQLLQTFVTLAFAAWVNGEQVDLLTWIFAVAVVGVVLIGRRTRIVKGS